MDDYLSKPGRPEQLDRVLERWTPRAPEPREPRHPSPKGEPDGSLDHTVLKDLRLIQQEGGGDIVRELIETFLSETPAHLDALQKTAERGETEPFRRQAHALNGICRGVGASRMGSICAELERLGESGDLAGAQNPLDRLGEEFDRVKVLLDAELSSR